MKIAPMAMQISLKFVPRGPTGTIIGTGSVIGLVPIGQQAIAWNNDT